MKSLYFFLTPFMSSRITSFRVSLRRTNLSSRSASYTSLDTLICGYSDFGDPLFLGINTDMLVGNINTMSITSTIIYRERD